MGKLHELLAVEEDAKGKAKHILEESIKVFKDKPTHFIEQIQKFMPFEENEKEIFEGELAMVTTVTEKLDYTFKALSRFIDCGYQKEDTNTLAKADIVLSNGAILAKEVPATALLFLEREIGKIYELVTSIPTLEPGIFWGDAKERGSEIYYHKDSKIRTKKVLKPIILYAATDKHPAQVEKVTEDVPTGNIERHTYSSKYTPLKKAQMIERLDDIKISIKKARQRANGCEASIKKIGDNIFNYVMKG